MGGEFQVLSLGEKYLLSPSSDRLFQMGHSHPGVSCLFAGTWSEPLWLSESIKMMLVTIVGNIETSPSKVFRPFLKVCLEPILKLAVCSFSV